MTGDDVRQPALAYPETAARAAAVRGPSAAEVALTGLEVERGAPARAAAILSRYHEKLAFGTRSSVG